MRLQKQPLSRIAARSMSLSFPAAATLLTANHTADSVSLVDLTSAKVVAELPCGRKPAGVACSADGRRVAVSNLWSGSVTLFNVEGTSLQRAGTAQVGPAPRGVVFAPDGDSFYVALASANEVVRVDWHSRKVSSRWPAPVEPAQAGPVPRRPIPRGRKCPYRPGTLLGHASRQAPLGANDSRCLQPARSDLQPQRQGAGHCPHSRPAPRHRDCEHPRRLGAQ